jgi:hypothetical protein
MIQLSYPAHQTGPKSGLENINRLDEEASAS